MKKISVLAVIILSLTEWITIYLAALLNLIVYFAGVSSSGNLLFAFEIFIIHVLYFFIAYKWKRIKLLIEPIIAMTILYLIFYLLNTTKGIRSPGWFSLDLEKDLMQVFFYAAILYAIFSLASVLVCILNKRSRKNL